ncbi:MAG: hypothetical protein JXB30_15205 [Anaerolineae bacterium]|nr:hypothetical protein [Anaerolineae bacterium]
MAKTHDNLVIQGLSGQLGNQLVVRHFKDGRTVVGKKPTFSDDREFSEKQKGHQSAFKEASAYAKEAAKTEAIYAEKAQGTSKTAYNVALADWFHPPEITGIDVSRWTGSVGEPIRIKALDDVKVKQVVVIIIDEAEMVIEQGAAEQVDNLWWIYTTTQTAPERATVIAAAQDLPGNVAQEMESRGDG